MPKRHTTQSLCGGFTLIELSIVLVIISLIVGGVLVGRDLIRAAGIRNTIKQRDMLDTAVNAFKGKYNCLPGDCANADVIGVGVSDITKYGGNGNGDETITWILSTGLFGRDPENINFWYHLSKAGLITWGPSTTTPALQNTCPGTSPCLPFGASASGNQGGWAIFYGLDMDAGPFPTDPSIFAYSAHHYWWLAGKTGEDVYDMTPSAGIFSPTDAYAIDMKIDDGLPYRGLVLASGSGASDPFGPTLPIALCANGSPAHYNLTAADTNCSLIILTSF